MLESADYRINSSAVPACVHGPLYMNTCKLSGLRISSGLFNHTKPETTLVIWVRRIQVIWKGGCQSFPVILL